MVESGNTFSSLIFANMAQLMNVMGLLIFPFKWGGGGGGLKYPLLLQFPYFELCDNDNKQSNYRLMNG